MFLNTSPNHIIRQVSRIPSLFLLLPHTSTNRDICQLKYGGSTTNHFTCRALVTSRKAQVLTRIERRTSRLSRLGRFVESQVYLKVWIKPSALQSFNNLLLYASDHLIILYANSDYFDLTTLPKPRYSAILWLNKNKFELHSYTLDKSMVDNETGFALPGGPNSIPWPSILRTSQVDPKRKIQNGWISGTSSWSSEFRYVLSHGSAVQIRHPETELPTYPRCTNTVSYSPELPLRTRVAIHTRWSRVHTVPERARLGRIYTASGSSRRYDLGIAFFGIFGFHGFFKCCSHLNNVEKLKYSLNFQSQQVSDSRRAEQCPAIHTCLWATESSTVHHQACSGA